MRCSNSSPCVVQTVHHVLTVHHMLFRQFTMCCGGVQTVHHVLWWCSDSSPCVVKTVHHVLFRQFTLFYTVRSPCAVQTVSHALFGQFTTCYSDSSPCVVETVPHELFRQFTTRYSLRCVLSSSGYNDELAWAAAWLYRVTGDKRYLQHAEENYVSTCLLYTSTLPTRLIV